MSPIKSKIEDLDWYAIQEQLNKNGYAQISGFLTTQSCKNLIDAYDQTQDYRKTVNMARHRFGIGEYKYFDYPLPNLVQEVRAQLYERLAPTANLWMKVLGIDIQFPPSHASFIRQCHEQGQEKPTALILKYATNGFNTLHQDLYGEIFFPIQAVFFLNEPDVDFTGGEFVMTQQIPRAQSKAQVLNPKKGDMLLFATNFLPVKGTRGYYRSIVKHGVSQVSSGQRHTMGIIFHDATS